EVVQDKEAGRHTLTRSTDVIQVWEASSGVKLGSLKDAPSHVTSVTYSPDGKLLAAAGDDGTVKVWDLASRRPRATPQTGERVSGTFRLTFSPDGKRLAFTGTGGALKVWNADTGQVTTPLGEVNSRTITFTPDGKQLATADQGTVSIRD